MGRALLTSRVVSPGACTTADQPRAALTVGARLPRRRLHEHLDTAGREHTEQTEAEQLTRENTSLLLIVAFNYGARDEIARAVRRIAERVATGAVKPEAITEEIQARLP